MSANRITTITTITATISHPQRFRLCVASVSVVVVAFALTIVGPPSVDCKFDVSRDVKFELHTREHSLESFEELRVSPYGRTVEPLSRGDAQTIFNATRPTRVFVHGYWSSRRAFLRYAKAFLHDGDCNFIAVNWLNGSKTYNYWRARGRVDRIGIALAELIDHLVTDYYLRLSDLLMVGHSLGAHIVGIAGQSVTTGKLPIIVGLDPAYPLFSRKNASNRLSADDAEYVQVIHTNGGRLSIPYPVGDADFYPNWGHDQPGCSGTKSDVCSHGRAHKLYIESLSPNSFFEGVQCASYEELKERECSAIGPNALMGTADPEVLKKARGIYYLITNNEPPYAVNHTGPIDSIYNV